MLGSDDIIGNTQLIHMSSGTEFELIQGASDDATLVSPDSKEDVDPKDQTLLPLHGIESSINGDYGKYCGFLTEISKLSLGMYNAVARKAFRLASGYRKKVARLEERLREQEDVKVENIADIFPKHGEPSYDLWDLRKDELSNDETTRYLSKLFNNISPDRWRNFEKLGGFEDDLNLVRYSDESEVLIKKFGINMTSKQLSCLDGPRWLNDEVINFYINMIQERNDILREKGVQGIPKCVCFNTFFFILLCGGDDDNLEYNYKAVSRWTTRRKIDIFETDILLIPVHAYKAHWALGIVDMRKDSRRILLFDSMCGSNKMFFKVIKKWLKDEHMDKKGIPLENVRDWKSREGFSAEPMAPRQQNGHDCGVFLCQYAECISISKMFDFSQGDIGDLRIKMIQQILRGSIFE